MSTNKVTAVYAKKKEQPFAKLAVDLLGIIESQEGEPWRKPWDPAIGTVQLAPYNALTGRKYMGMYNSMHLAKAMVLAASEVRSLDVDPRFLTQKQFFELATRNKELEGIEGTKPYGIYVPILVNAKKKEAPESEPEMSSALLESDPEPAPVEQEEDSPKRVLVGYRTCSVKNVVSFTGLPPFEILPEQEEQIKQAVYKSVATMQDELDISISHGGPKAYYLPSTDHVQMPPIHAFSNPDSYVTVLMHELIHATAHPSRLDRATRLQDFVANLDVKDIEGTCYALEEFVADIGSAQACMQMHMRPLVLENHPGYLESWFKPLKENIPDRTKMLHTLEFALRRADFASAHLMKMCGEAMAMAVRDIYELNRIDLPEIQEPGHQAVVAM